jgi:serine/threonine-protein kinase RsbT
VSVLRDERLPLRSSEDIAIVRQAVRVIASEIGFGLVDQTKIVTATSELGRNTVQHGLGGTAHIQMLNDGPRKGVRITFEDSGPGIPDIELAMRDGYSTGGGMGLGLSGSKRLSNEFAIESEVGRGTRVMIARWR